MSKLPVLLAIAMATSLAAGCLGDGEAQEDGPEPNPSPLRIHIPVDVNATLGPAACIAPILDCLNPTSAEFWFDSSGTVAWNTSLDVSWNQVEGNLVSIKVTLGPALDCGESCRQWRNNRTVEGTSTLKISESFAANASDNGFLIRVEAATVPQAHIIPMVNLTVQGALLAEFPKPPVFGASRVARHSDSEFPIWLASRSLGGEPGNGISHTPSLDFDGSHLAFVSLATNLVSVDVPDCTFEDTTPSPCAQTYVLDLNAGSVKLASSDNAGLPGTDSSGRPQIAGDGQEVAYVSNAKNLGSGQALSVLIKNIESEAIERVDVNTREENGNIESNPNDEAYGSRCTVWCGGPSMPWNQDAVVFGSWSSNLVADDHNQRPDVFLRDWRNGNTIAVSTNSSGHLGNDASYTISGGRYVSSDGTRIAFTSAASNFGQDLPKDCMRNASPPLPYALQACPQVYVKDLATGSLLLASSTADGEPGSAISQAPVISADGSKVTFITIAPELLGEDPNGRHQAVVKDLHTGNIQVISKRSDGRLWPQDVLWVSMDAYGERVVFSAGQSIRGATATGEDPSNGGIFLHETGLTEPMLVSVRQDGTPSRAATNTLAISGNGRWLAFDSGDTLLVGGTNHHQIYVVDLDSVVTSRQSHDVPGISPGSMLLALVGLLVRTRLTLASSRHVGPIPYDT